MTTKKKPRTNPLQVVVFRDSDDECTCAVLRCRRTRKVCDGDTLREALTRALTKWFAETEEGREALEDSSDDFNVGDLSVHYPDETLLPYLTAAGVFDLEVETYVGDATDWSYDQLLFDAGALGRRP